ncbi:hypothetical protein [Caminicella sporogenes]|uniref:hypothetical protein n=1 Tax=Caminicella sporogenes TaxID=166485 RepID=UPI0025405ABF|nr:hypothetical protein [Caminicella sporogenes]WIF95686.1 hypothetical protein QNI18_03475 [Caminicella sporogenes]
MKERKKFLYGVLFLVGLAVISGIMTFLLVNGKEGRKIEADKKQIFEEHKKDVQSVDLKREDKENALDINKIFDDVKHIYIKNINNPTNMIEVTGEDRGFIVANFKGFKKEKSDINQFNEEVLDLESYDYEIDLIEKNIKLKLYGQNGYMLVDTNNEGSKIYKIQKSDMDNLIPILEKVYLQNLMDKLLYPIPENIYLYAEDEKAVRIINKKESKELISKFNILSIEEQQNFIGVPTLYPNYDITIKRGEDKYKFHLINKEIMLIDTPIVFLYCKYDGEIWDYISKKLPVQNNAKKNEIKYLLKSDRVIVKDIEGIYDLESNSYYNIEIARCLNSSNREKLNNDKSIDEDLRLILKFIINEDIKEVLVYDNYFVYDNVKYFSKNIGEKIKSLLMVP